MAEVSMKRLGTDDLIEKLAEAERQSQKLRLELDAMKHREAIYNEGFRLGTELQAFIRGLVDGGLTEEQAFALMLAKLDGGTK